LSGVKSQPLQVPYIEEFTSRADGVRHDLRVVQVGRYQVATPIVTIHDGKYGEIWLYTYLRGLLNKEGEINVATRL
jgi:hypothetical protein